MPISRAKMDIEEELILKRRGASAGSRAESCHCTQRPRRLRLMQEENFDVDCSMAPSLRADGTRRHLTITIMRIHMPVAITGNNTALMNMPASRDELPSLVNRPADGWPNRRHIAPIGRLTRIELQGRLRYIQLVRCFHCTSASSSASWPCRRKKADI